MTNALKDIVIQMNTISGGLNLISYKFVGETSNGVSRPSTSFVVVKNKANKHKMKKFIVLNYKKK